MLRIVTCISQEHDIRLVLLAALLCLFACFTAFGLIARAQQSEAARSQVTWTVAAAVVAGCGVWATHFVAMLAFRPGLPLGYDIGLTAASVLVAVSMIGFGFLLALARPAWKATAGAVVGLAVGAMHFVGMTALRVPAALEYDPTYVIASLLMGAVLGSAAMAAAGDRLTVRSRAAACSLLALGICGLHFTAMAAVTVVPDPRIQLPGAALLEPEWLAVMIAVVTVLIMALGLVSAILDQRLAQRANDANRRLVAEAAERARAQAELRLAHDNLERLVAERTSELQAALLTARAASEAKSDFLASMSHELRTPLNAIIGYSEILLEDAEADGRCEQVTDLTRITNSGSHLLSLINNVLDLSRIEAGRLDLSIESFSLDEFVSDMMAACEPLARKNGNRLAMRPRPPLGLGRGDATKFRQCALNLLGNASKFTTGGEIEIDAYRSHLGESEHFVFAVRDTGIGIAPEHIRKLFRPFSQAEKSTSGRFGGAGLGLSLTDQLCRLMGGAVEVESAVGVGSTFTLRIPIEPPDSAIPNTITARGDRSTRRGAVVLLVDDDPTVCDLATRILSKEGCKLLLATTAEQGLEIARVSRPDVIILDVLLPGQDGFQLLRRLKEDSRLRRIPVVMLSMVDERRTGIDLGAVEYLVKPVERSTLIGALQRAQHAA